MSYYIEKLDDCPDCGKALGQGEYDLQFCRACGTGFDFSKPIPESDLVRLARPAAPIGNGTTVGAQPVAHMRRTMPPLSPAASSGLIDDYHGP